MLLLVILQTYFFLFLLLIWDFILFLVLLGLFSKNLDFKGLKKSDTFCLASALAEAEASQSTGSFMSCHLS